MTNILQGFNPNVLFQGGNFSPVSSYQQGQNVGLAQIQNQQAIDAERERVAQDEAMMGLDLQSPTLIQDAVNASPDIAREIIKRQILAQMGGKKQQFAPNWGKIKGPDGVTRMASFTQDEQGNPIAKIATLEGGGQAEAYEREMGHKKIVNQDGTVWWVNPQTNERSQMLNDDGTPFIDVNFKIKQDELTQKESLFNQKMRLDRDKMTQEDKQFIKQHALSSSKNAIALAENQRKDLKQEWDFAKEQYKVEKEQADFEEKLQGYENTVIDGLRTIDLMIGNENKGIPQHAGLSGVVGREGGASLFGLMDEPFQGTEEADFAAMYNKIKSKAFTQAFQSLKGGGTITETEGEAATKALFAAQTSQDEKSFIREVQEFRKQLILGLRNAQKAKERKKKTKETKQTLKVYSREDAINAFKNRFGKDPNESQINMMMKNMGAK